MARTLLFVDPMEQQPNKNSDQDRFQNTERDEATLGRSGLRQPTQAGLADEDQPIQRPPESQPEPRPATPVMSPSPNPNPSTNTNSPA